MTTNDETNFEYWWPKNVNSTTANNQMFTACGGRNKTCSRAGAPLDECAETDETAEHINLGSDNVVKGHHEQQQQDDAELEWDESADNNLIEDDFATGGNSSSDDDDDRTSQDSDRGSTTDYDDDDDDDDYDAAAKKEIVFETSGGRKKHTKHEYVMTSALINGTPVRKRYYVRATTFKGAARKIIVKVCRSAIHIPENSTKTVTFSKMQMFRIRPLPMTRLSKLIDARTKSEVSQKFAKLNPEQWPQIFVKLAHQYSGRVHFYNKADALQTRIGNVNTLVRVKVEIGAPNSRAAKRFANVKRR